MFRIERLLVVAALGVLLTLGPAAPNLVWAGIDGCDSSCSAPSDSSQCSQCCTDIATCKQCCNNFSGNQKTLCLNYCETEFGGAIPPGGTG